MTFRLNFKYLDDFKSNPSLFSKSKYVNNFPFDEINFLFSTNIEKWCEDTFGYVPYIEKGSYLNPPHIGFKNENDMIVFMLKTANTKNYIMWDMSHSNQTARIYYD